MPQQTLKTLVAVAVLGFASASVANLQADDQTPVGIVRISDHSSTGASGSSVTLNQYGQPCDHCNGGNECQQGSSCYCPLCAMLHRDGVTYSPDHGFRRPVVEHIQRIPVEYRRYWPAKWYGEPGSGVAAGSNPYPTVYMPTDTTQLGYYYQRVPQWRPKPGMVPPRPWPSQWHRREVCNDCYNGNMIGDPQLAPAEGNVTPQPDSTVPPSPPTEPTGPQASFQTPPAVDGLVDETELTGA